MVSTSRILEIYHAVRLSYKSKYDYFKYNGKLGRSFDGENNKHYSTLLKLQKRFTTEDSLRKHFAFNFLSGDTWLASIADQRSLCVTAEFEKRDAALDIYFKEDIEKLKEKYTGKEGFKKLVTETEFNAPLFSLMLGGHIHFSTFAYINSITNSSDKWKSKIWKTYKNKIELTIKFMQINNDTKLKITNILIEGLDLR